jgi:hypothetical protein
VVAGIAPKNPHGAAADDGLEIAEMRHVRIAFVADARRDVRTVGQGNRIGGCHGVDLVEWGGKCHGNAALSMFVNLSRDRVRALTAWWPSSVNFAHSKGEETP